MKTYIDMPDMPDFMLEAKETEHTLKLSTTAILRIAESLKDSMPLEANMEVCIEDEIVLSIYQDDE